VAPVEIDVRLQDSENGFDCAVRCRSSSRDVVLESLRNPCVGKILKDQHAKAMNRGHD